MSQQPVVVPTASLHNKVALITGAGRGIGRSIALELAHRGCSIVVNYRGSKGPAEEVCRDAEAYKNGARAVAIQADVSKPAEITRLFEEAIKIFGKLNIVCSNSGTESWGKSGQIPEEEFDRVFTLNAKAQFFVANAAFKYCEPGSHITLTSSISAGNMGIRDHALYNASKSAVIGMVKAFAVDFGREKNIRVNAIAPGGIKTDMFTEHAWRYIPGATADWSAEKIEGMLAGQTPLGRCAVPSDVAKAVAFLVSDDAGWVNGEVLHLTGGANM
ncbi:MAG: hypothetical protein M1828_001669 [Chrysothrix sp. TS-e1954]|nr:MAG: hypothetical protein M1828_001669 [Chrysothrix sp. TS-e1954]